MENTDYQTVENFNPEEKRPGGLIALCVLTFIGSGFMFLSNFVSFALYNALPGFMEAAAATMSGSMGDMYRESINAFVSIPRYTFLLSTILYVFSISGAAIMLVMRKIGFHVYAVAQILIVFLPQLLNKTPFNIWGFILAIVFIALYFIYYKKMK